MELRKVFFVWVNNTQATIGFWVLVAVLVSYVVVGIKLWRELAIEREVEHG